jgi:hypothetical protein
MCKPLLPIFMFTVSVFCTGAAMAQLPTPGLEPFVPTRLEWMEVYLNAGKGVPYSEKYGYGISYVADLGSDTMFVVAQFDEATVNEEIMENAINSAKGIVSLYAKRKGWDSWLVIKELRQPLKVIEARPVDDTAQPLEEQRKPIKAKPPVDVDATP